MWFLNAQIHIEDQAARVKRQCPNCSNVVEFQLLWNKAGLSLGIPVVMLFTDKARISTHKHFHLGCPVCGYIERIDKNIAQGLIAEGKAK
jgi:predicted RNA-binding Zn-ribbon protein involved in translation (DUF1610 family)